MAGICYQDEQHFLSDRDAYSVPHVPAGAGQIPPIPPPAPPLIVDVSEVGEQITVRADRCTPRGTVTVTFVRGPDQKRVTVTADDAGGIYYLEYPADIRHGGGAVMVTDLATGRWTPGQTRRCFPTLPTEATPIDPGSKLEPFG